MPQPPADPSPRYNARLARARSSNRLSRTGSSASLTEGDNLPRAPAASKPIWSQSTGLDKEEGIRAMLRDVTLASLPTRGPMMASGIHKKPLPAMQLPEARPLAVMQESDDDSDDDISPASRGRADDDDNRKGPSPTSVIRGVEPQQKDEPETFEDEEDEEDDDGAGAAVLACDTPAKPRGSAETSLPESSAEDDSGSSTTYPRVWHSEAESNDEAPSRDASSARSSARPAQQTGAKDAAEPEEPPLYPPSHGGPPPIPGNVLGDMVCLPGKGMSAQALIGELQTLLNSRETDMKRLLTLPMEKTREVHMDVVRSQSGFSSSKCTYRCYLRLAGSSGDRRVCIFEATHSRKGAFHNSQYRIHLPADDPRMLGGILKRGMREDELDRATYCGKVRSYNMAGANFILYDDGHKPDAMAKAEKEGYGHCRPRQQMAALAFTRSSSRRVPMTLRMLLPQPEPANSVRGENSPVAIRQGPEAELLDSLQGAASEGGEPPEGTRLLKLVPPRWNADHKMFQLFCEGRACCMSNKNLQLADGTRPDEAALQVGKLRDRMFNVDFNGCVSPLQAFASALAVFDQSSVRRRL